jgi:predicted component of type VI protein secretion system
MPAQLVALGEGPNILLDKPVLLVGRHPECDIQIDSRKISRRHCCIAQVNDYLVIRDLGSTNGIRINNVRVLEGRLRQSDELTIGNSRYRVRWDSLDAPAAEPRQVGMAAHTARAEVVEDDDLESCDEPVPLAEPGVEHAGPRPQPLDDEESIIIPDHLELAPLSDVIPPGQPPR